MSNLIKSGFVAFSQDKKLLINADENKIIKAMNSDMEEKRIIEQPSVEEALAEALILDAELEGTNFDKDLSLMMDEEQIILSSDVEQDVQQMMEEMLRSAKDEAEEIISRAHDEAEQLRAEAFDEAEKIKKQAQEEGYQVGYDTAMDSVLKEYAEKEAELDCKMREGEEQLQERSVRLVEETEHKMVELLCQLIPSITGIVVEGQRDVLLYMINAAMHDLDNSKHFVIKVSSSDYEDLVERKEEIYGALNPAIDMEIFEDAKLASLQCIIETDNGMVDISLDVQLDNLIKALKFMVKE
ncbi:MAG: hypothetical protein IJD40_02415 [Lachnospiraceae bacterium]|nr:hypothetical protein [Lachnospiraceae bacterium]